MFLKEFSIERGLDDVFDKKIMIEYELENKSFKAKLLRAGLAWWCILHEEYNRARFPLVISTCVYANEEFTRGYDLIVGRETIFLDYRQA